MTFYRMDGVLVESDTPELVPALEAAYLRRERPRCQCQSFGVEMYIAKVAGRHVLKRMPNTGSLHAPGCESYDPPPELSGLGQVLGTAIEENVDDGHTALKLGFSLSKGGTRASPTNAAVESDSVKTDGSKLTLRGTLHYLWEQAGFNKWTPGMDGKRSWFVIRKYLLRAAQDKRAKGQDLSELLYIPEPFRTEDKDGITQRRSMQFGKIAGVHKTGRLLNIVIGEVKEISQSRFGFKTVLKHVPDVSFMLNEDIHRRMMRRFGTELGLWDAADDVHLVMVATFGVGVTGVPGIEEAALMTVNSNWIPVETMFDKSLVDKLILERRRFVKGLRYNLPSARPLAAAVLSDTEPKATALYIVPPGAEDEFTAATNGLIAESDLDSWLWHAGEENPHDLPPIALPPYRPDYSKRIPSDPPSPQKPRESRKFTATEPAPQQHKPETSLSPTKSIKEVRGNTPANHNPDPVQAHTTPAKEEDGMKSVF